MICPSCITSAAVDEAYNPAPLDGVQHDDVVTSIVVATATSMHRASKIEGEDDASRVKREKKEVRSTSGPWAGQDALKTAHSSLPTIQLAR